MFRALRLLILLTFSGSALKMNLNILMVLLPLKKWRSNETDLPLIYFQSALIKPRTLGATRRMFQNTRWKWLRRYDSVTYSLAVGFIQRTLLLDLCQLHVDLLADHCHGVPT